MPQAQGEHDGPRALDGDVHPDALDPLLALLRDRDGLDLSGYRRSTLARRVRNRMISAGVAAPPAARAGFAPTPEVRARVTFERHDLARDAAPGVGLDLVSCRNTLIYFDAPLQRRALPVPCDALAPGGLLWLGQAEWPSGGAAARLAPVDRQARLFRLAEGRAHA